MVRRAEESSFSLVPALSELGNTFRLHDSPSQKHNLTSLLGIWFSSTPFVRLTQAIWPQLPRLNAAQRREKCLRSGLRDPARYNVIDSRYKLTFP